MLEDNNVPHLSPFDAVRQVDEDGNEYWSARDMARLLEYAKWDKFKVALGRAQKACERSGERVSDHFLQSGKLIRAGKGAHRTVEDHHLSRYACYLLVENADPEKTVVALGQAYFALQTRRQELADTESFTSLPEDQKRLVLRSEMAVFNRRLADTAQGAGVIKPGDFQLFQDHGYRGLYGGLTENAIHARKKLRSDDRILDYMGSEELGANIFRATQTDAKLRREGIQGKQKANQTHYEVGKKVRQTIEELGGTMPEDLPTPGKSIQQIQYEEQRRIEQKRQPSLFDQEDM